jgi:hypothetical protein
MTETIAPLPIVHRTFELPADVWDKIRKRGRREGKSMRWVISDAVEAELFPLMDSLRALGLDAQRPRNKLVRSPVDGNIIARLKHVKGVTGVPAVELLILCLQKHATRP